MWVHFHTPDAVKNDVRFDQFSETLKEVLQIISGGGKANEGPDFRRNGKYPLRFKLSYSANTRVSNTENVQVGLFQETDPTKWQQTSTTYRQLSNVAEVPSKPPATKVAPENARPNRSR